MIVTVLGLGYVGLTTAAGLAELGHYVVGVDIDNDKIEMLNRGDVPIWEPELAPLIAKNRQAQRLAFTTDVQKAASQSDVILVAVGTPAGPDGKPDLTQLERAVSDLTSCLPSDALLIIKSTVPVGTTDQIATRLRRDVVHNPEFLRQGSAVHDFFHPDRIVIGCGSEWAAERIRRLYQGITAPMIVSDRRSAEMIKYTANAFLAMKISYINMIADLCESLDANVEDVARGIGADHRIGHAFLQAGAGYGGSCFPKDTHALLYLGAQTGCSLPLVESADRINQLRPQRLVTKAEHALGTLRGKHISLLGLTYKPQTDDVRSAPSIAVSRLLLEQGANVHAYDPRARRFPIEQVEICPDVETAVHDADAVMILTEWDEFRHLDWRRLLPILRCPVIIDGRNLYRLEEMRKLGVAYPLRYLSVGRPEVNTWR
ncbi:UDP-glucose dehydrogenase family protein [Polycladomyces subterraneus]|uniref:UDP-glucose 6-dehydrogenase n=1 Tax=Polycladomyces subterraneus TaxID=1016997 RepID=A0ABT8IPF0_9BACL|nr:UDP-glucose/GDP-mannose dehydrogenase family protein [Polycladomyces subterraneus]MDN4594652.1 UDP-glucose/GDP-mannose dehydrogenase family protein [Polycladomyces subterraneus]